MNDESAKIIANDFLSTMNPENWNGIGEKPKSLNTLIKTYDIGSESVELDISFEFCKEDNSWEHYCELRDKQTGDLLVPLHGYHGYGIDSPQNLIDTILDVCAYI